MKAIDNNFNTTLRTQIEDNPYVQIDLDSLYYIPYIKIYYPGQLQQYYVFTSETPIDQNNSLNDLLNNPNIISNQVFNYSSGERIYLRRAARYLRIQINNYDDLEISELNIPGDGIIHEICGNNVDDNCDGKIDCDDIQCGIRIFNVSVKDASCPICPDGEISIQAFGNNKLYSIDGGQTFSNDCYNSFENMCFYGGLVPGSYEIVVKNSVTGCETVYPFTVSVGSPGPGVDGICENGGFEHGNFDNWTAECGYNILGAPNPDCNLTVTQSGLFFDQGYVPGRQSIILTNTFYDPFAIEINGSYPPLGM